MKNLFSDLYDHFTRIETIEWWFKWLEWVTLTAAVSAAWWITKSNFVIPIVIISFWYVWHSSFRGIGYFLFSYLTKWNLKKQTIDVISKIVGSFLTLYVFMMLTILFIGLFRL